MRRTHDLMIARRAPAPPQRDPCAPGAARDTDRPMERRPRWRGVYQVPLVLLWTGIYYPPLILFTVLTFGLITPAWMQWYARVWGRVILLLLSVRLEVEGEEVIRERAPRIMLFNHSSLLDLFVVCAVFPPAGVAVVKKEIGSW